MSTSRRERGATLRGAQLIALLYSILFFFLIATGYYLLFQQNMLVALAAAVLFPCLAWGLARYIGFSSGGIRTHMPLFILLLLISALGVFNSLMLNLEGRQIFVEAINDSQDRFDKLRSRAIIELSKGGTDSTIAHMQRVDGLKAALFSEIRNPLNCGQGPEARKIVADLRAELPEFRPLSAKAVDCSQNLKVIDDYENRINEAVKRAAWSNESLLAIVTNANAAKKDLEMLRRLAGESFAPRLLSEVKPQLEAKDGQYRDLLDGLPSTDDANAGLPARLELRSVESLGEWSQLVNIVLDRWNKPTTWIYFALAAFADWMMVHLFSLVRNAQPRRSESDVAGSDIGRAF